MKAEETKLYALLGKNIREMREKRSFTQEYLAAKLRLNQSNIHRLESGMAQIKIFTLLQLCSVLNVNLSDFMNHSGYEEIYAKMRDELENR